MDQNKVKMSDLSTESTPLLADQKRKKRRRTSSLSEFIQAAKEYFIKVCMK